MSSPARPQTIRDSRILAAMAHPVRRRLLDVLRAYGPSTVTHMAERTSQASGNVSHHLRLLAASGLVVEAPELSRDRRERWWRLAPIALRWSAADLEDDPVAYSVALAAESLNLDRQVELVRSWLTSSGDERSRWGDGPFSVDSWLRLTPNELAEFGEQITNLIAEWQQRTGTSTDGERQTVFFFARGVPGRP
ncbi:ArsR family transcriptional regulator [Micromonospora sp. 15K316]|nr:metalloregulator ArsR/SmtB family transcription factor [Micromonospora sp. 15K316]TDC30354.1 ArsR family transcriptional regulator [Micromonospora sp. 15K316]